MDWINDSDWNATARFQGEQATSMLDAHCQGASLAVEPVPGTSGTELLVLFRAEAGAVAATRLKDLLLMAGRHCPELWQDVHDELGMSSTNSTP